MLTLRSSLLLNGISSGVTGLGLVIFAEQVASLFAVPNKDPFVYTGIFLVLFAMFVMRTAFHRAASSAALMVIRALDVAWIVCSIGAVLIAGGAISTIGNFLIVAVAGWVGLMALLQAKAQKKWIEFGVTAQAA